MSDTEEGGTLVTGAEFNRFAADRSTIPVKYYSSRRDMYDINGYHTPLGQVRTDRFFQGGHFDDDILTFSLASARRKDGDNYAFEVEIPDDAQVWMWSMWTFKADRMVVVKEMPAEWYVKQFRERPRLDHLPRELRTLELCKIALKDGLADDLGRVPFELRTPKLLKYALKRGFSLHWIPPNLRTEELYLTAIAHDGDALFLVPQHMWTPEFLLKAFKVSIDIRLRDIPKRLRTKELCMEAVSRMRMESDLLRHMPEDICTLELCVRAMKAYPEAVEYLPERFRRPELYMLAAREWPLALKRIPVWYRTEAVCTMAVVSRAEAFAYVPDEVMTPDLCRIAIAGDPCMLRFVPMELRSPELCSRAVKGDARMLKYVPRHLVTREMCVAALCAGPEYAIYIPRRLFTQEMFCLMAVSLQGLLLRLVPEPLRTLDVCSLAVKRDGRRVIKHVPAALRDRLKEL